MMVEEEQRRGPWAQHEDEILMRLVQQHGPFHWVDISKALRTRSPKQCRERYHQNLKPSLNHEPISAEEGELIDQLVHQLGKRWAEIARRLNNRSDNAVKNWWNGSMNRRKRMSRRKGSASSEDNYPHRQGPPRLVTDAPWHPAYAACDAAYSPSSRRFSQSTWNTHPSGLPSPTGVSPTADPYAPEPCSSIFPNAATTRPSSSAFASDASHTLRPLRRESGSSAYEPGQMYPVLLPSIAPGGAQDTMLLPPIRTAAEARSQLPTAPNSPLELPTRPATRHHSSHHGHHGHHGHHRHSSLSSRGQAEHPPGVTNAKMKLSNILG